MKIPFSSTMTVLAATALFVISGCGESYTGPELETCKGTVTLDGAPCADANISMANSQVTCSAKSDAEGKWAMVTGQGPKEYPGAPIGTFTPTVKKTEQLDIGVPEPGDDAPSDEVEKYQMAMEKAMAAGTAVKYIVPEKYGNPKSSGLTIEVKAGGAEDHKLELTSGE